MGSSESTLVKMPHCWKSHATAYVYICASHMKVFFSQFRLEYAHRLRNHLTFNIIMSRSHATLLKIILLSIFVVGIHCETAITRKTKYGSVLGKLTSLSQKYLGVPFAAPAKRYGFKARVYPRGEGGGGGGTLIFSYIRRLGSFLGGQNFEFQYFWGFRKIIFFGV